MRREGELCERFRGVEGKECKAASSLVVATGVTYGQYALLSFGEISRRQMAFFDVGGTVELVWALRCAGSCIGGLCVYAPSPVVSLGQSTLYDVSWVHGANPWQYSVGV